MKINEITHATTLTKNNYNIKNTHRISRSGAHTIEDCGHIL